MSSRFVPATTALVISLFIAPLASAQSSGAGFKFSLGIGITGGGDKISSYQVQTDFGSSSNSIRAGGESDVRFGMDYRFNDSWALQTSIGYHSDRVSADNGSASFKRFPLDVTGSYTLPGVSMRLGVGLRKPLSPKFNERGAAGDARVSFSSSVSPLVYAEYLWSGIGVRLQGSLSEKYKVNGTTATLKGNHIGLYGTAYF
jgi:hypothetical protein